MRRWNGWGDDNNEFPLKPAGLAFLKDALGEGRQLPDAELKDVLAKVPASRLTEHPLIDTSDEIRVRHARGQSLPDWLAMRSGNFGNFPDGVAEPRDSAEVRQLLDWARENSVHVIIYGGGTSVAGHINPPAGDTPDACATVRFRID